MSLGNNSSRTSSDQHSAISMLTIYNFHYNLKTSPLNSFAGHTTVLILGGGMAGVAAAHTLQSQGLQDFLLLEASERLGGRMSNINFCGINLVSHDSTYNIVHTVYSVKDLNR